MLSVTEFVSLINLALIIFVAVVNHLNHLKITTNDLVHLSADVKEIMKKTEENSKDIKQLAVDMSYLKGNCALNACKKV